MAHLLSLWHRLIKAKNSTSLKIQILKLFMANLNHTYKSVKIAWLKPGNMQLMTSRSRCLLSMKTIFRLGILSCTRNPRDNGLRIRDLWLKRILDLLRRTRTQRIAVHTLRAGSRWSTKLNRKSFRRWFRIPRRSFHCCHGQKRWKKKISWHLTLQPLKL